MTILETMIYGMCMLGIAAGAVVAFILLLYLGTKVIDIWRNPG